MSGTAATMFWIYAAIVAIWPIRYVVLTVILRGQEVLDGRSPRFGGAAAPLVSAILPCKDEEVYLANCLASVCARRIPTSRSSSSTTGAPTARGRLRGNSRPGIRASAR